MGLFPFNRPEKDGSQLNSNPSLGLGIWGPLVPANDCKNCLGLLAGLQLGAGAWLWLRPGRRPPPSRGIWANRGIKLAGAIAGSYLVLMSGFEFARLALPYDPWVEDAKAARQACCSITKEDRGHWSPSTWWYQWFGPSNYHAVSWKEWQQRTTAYFEKVEHARPHFEKLKDFHESLSKKNLSTAAEVHRKIAENEIQAPELAVQELEALRSFPDIDDDADLYDEIDLSIADLWDFFEEPRAFSVIFVPRSTKAFIPGVVMDNETLFKSQNVNYMPIPQIVKHSLR